jgi:GNAT superfamily N-acetyltransferase
VGWSRQRVLEASAAWTSSWYPPGSLHRALGWLEYYVVGSTATVMRLGAMGRDVDRLVESVRAELRSEQVTEAYWTVGPASWPPGLDDALISAGAGVDSTVDICARDLTGGLPGTPEGAAAKAAVSVRHVSSREDVAAFQQVTAAAWGYPPPSSPSQDDVERAFANLRRGYVLGCWQGRPVGVGGYTLAADVARFWGAAVVPAARGRGVYRAMVRARMADAAEQGATLALVHARPSSSAVLQRVGFTVHGQQRVLAFRP